MCCTCEQENGGILTLAGIDTKSDGLTNDSLKSKDPSSKHAGVKFFFISSRTHKSLRHNQLIKIYSKCLCMFLGN